MFPVCLRATVTTFLRCRKEFCAAASGAVTDSNVPTWTSSAGSSTSSVVSVSDAASADVASAAGSAGPRLRFLCSRFHSSLTFWREEGNRFRVFLHIWLGNCLILFGFWQNDHFLFLSGLHRNTESMFHLTFSPCREEEGRFLFF